MTTKCPMCRRLAIKDGNKVFPFCSERCQLIDLGRWLNEEYRVPGEPADPQDIVREPSFDPEGSKHE